VNKTETFLRERYIKTHWPYYSLSWTRYDIGESFNEDIKELREKEMIEPCMGINGWLIKIINLNIWNL